MKKIIILCILSLFVNDCHSAKHVRKRGPKIVRLVTDAKKSPTKITNASKKEPEAEAEQAFLMDFDTDECLFEKNANERCVPSSMTKLMTIYLLFEALDKGVLKLDDELPVSKFAQSKEGSRSFFKAGTLAKVEDLIRSIVVHSGNDGCAIVAEAISGDEDAFAVLMNEKAALFGLKNTNFKNSTGLPDDEHYSCAGDLALIAKRLIADFPQHYHYFSEKTFTVNDIAQQNRNVLLGNSLNVDGLKTGKTNAGGLGIVVSAKKDEKRLIGVVNGCKTVRGRSVEANKLLALGFSSFVNITVATAYNTIGEAKVLVGKSDHVDICVHEDITVMVQKKYKNDIVVELSVDEPLEAPVVAGTKVGTMIFKYGKVTSKKYDLFARETIDRLKPMERVKKFFVDLVSSDGSEKTKKTPPKTPK